MGLDNKQLHWIHRETLRRLQVFQRRVREGKCVMEAADFAKWLLNSGICEHLADNSETGPLPVDGKELLFEANCVLTSCQEYWRDNPTLCAIDRSDLEAINRKLDLMAGHLARIGIEILPARSEPGVELTVVPKVQVAG